MKLAAVLLIVGSGAVAQDCPTSADLETGLVLSSSVAEITMLNRSTDTGLEVTATLPPNGPQPMLHFQHPLALASTADTPVLYATDPATLEDLQETRVWSSAVQLTTAEGTTLDANHEIVLSGLGTAELSGCSYDIWRIDETVTFADGNTRRMQRIYAPDLGLQIGETLLDQAGQPLGGLSFDQITAE